MLAASSFAVCTLVETRVRCQFDGSSVDVDAPVDTAELAVGRRRLCVRTEAGVVSCGRIRREGFALHQRGEGVAAIAANASGFGVLGTDGLVRHFGALYDDMPVLPLDAAAGVEGLIAGGDDAFCGIVAGEATVRCWRPGSHRTARGDLRLRPVGPSILRDVRAARLLALSDSALVLVDPEGVAHQVELNWSRRAVRVASVTAVGVDNVAHAALRVDYRNRGVCVASEEGPLRCRAHDSERWVSVDALTSVRALVGGRGICGLAEEPDASGNLVCWGDNDTGRLGRPGPRSYQSPAPVVGIANAAAIFVDDRGACARVGDGPLSCWGSVAWPGARPEHAAPPSPFVDPAARLVTWGNTSACIQAEDGVQCQGWLSLRPNATEDSPPALVARGLRAVELAVGPYMACGRTAERQVNCWSRHPGYDEEPFAPIGPLPRRSARIPNLEAVHLATLGSSICAATPTGSVVCWMAPDPAPGQVREFAPTPNPFLAGAHAWTQWGATVCGAFESEVRCRGVHDADGVLTLELAAAELAIRSRGEVRDPAELCARTSDGRVVCAVLEGERLNPVAVPELTEVVEIDARYHLACARRRDGSVWCWSDRHDGLGRPAPPSQIETPFRPPLR